MSNTYSLVFENYLNEEADQKTVSLLICSLINDLESAGPEDKPELLKTARYVRDAAEKVKNDSIDEEKIRFWNRVSCLISTSINNAQEVANVGQYYKYKHKNS